MLAPGLALPAAIDFPHFVDGPLLPDESHERIVLARHVQHGLRFDVRLELGLGRRRTRRDCRESVATRRQMQIREATAVG
jgi:hypothetical protein